MRVSSKVEAGFRQNGQPILRVGLNVLEEPLTLMEREFITAMIGAQLAEVVSEEVSVSTSSETIEPPPSSETKLTPAAKVEVVPRMRVRRSR